MIISPNDQPLSMHFIEIPSIDEALMSNVCPSPKSTFEVEDHTFDASYYSFQDTSQIKLYIVEKNGYYNLIFTNSILDHKDPNQIDPMGRNILEFENKTPLFDECIHIDCFYSYLNIITPKRSSFSMLCQIHKTSQYHYLQYKYFISYSMFHMNCNDIWYLFHDHST